MGVARQTASPHVHAREVLVVGAYVIGWSAGRLVADTPATPAPVVQARRPLWTRPGRLVLAGLVATLVVAGAGLTARPDVASAPLVAPKVAARERELTARAAEARRIATLRHLELSGIAGRRVGEPAAAKPTRKRALPPLPVLKPGERAIALDTYIQALGTDTILRGLDASRDELQQQVLHDPRVHIYPGGIGDIEAGKVDVRVLAMIEYLAQANGEVTVTCLISGHSYFVHGRPGVVSAHMYGRAVDIGAVAGISILGNQGPGTITERVIRQILALPASVEPKQVISLMTLGGPSFALPDHYNHVHVGY